jgi:hypothetical protein
MASLAPLPRIRDERGVPERRDRSGTVAEKSKALVKALRELLDDAARE